MPVVATCPLCKHQYPFNFPSFATTKEAWDVLAIARVNFVTMCPECKGRFRANMNDFLTWSDYSLAQNRLE